jgi:hypothetical protein
MYVCMYVCMYACVCIHAFMHAWTLRLRVIFYLDAAPSRNCLFGSCAFAQLFIWKLRLRSYICLSTLYVTGY